jgi:hypothetical protein
VKRNAQHADAGVDAKRFHGAIGVEVAACGHDAVARQALSGGDALFCQGNRNGRRAMLDVRCADEAQLVAVLEVVEERLHQDFFLRPHGVVRLAKGVLAFNGVAGDQRNGFEIVDDAGR